MSYLVFARKWRPLTFEDVVGQQHITDTLKHAITKDRVAHAYIFTGTRGVGKTTTARILARALNCDNGPTENPCGVCDSCKNILKGSSFDVVEIDGASHNGVDSIRELQENLNYSSMNGKYRIIVIDEVHMLSKAAFNALLKTLEEPPENVIFIFATTEPEKIPNTIHSRCQRYDFRRISLNHIAGQLERICTNEGIKFEKDALTLISRRADGSMRDSLSLLDQCYSFCRDGLTESEVRSVLGLVDLDIYNQILRAIAESNPAPALMALDSILNSGFDLPDFVTGFQDYLRTLLFNRLPGVMESLKTGITKEKMDIITEAASSFSEADLIRMAEVLKKAEAEMRWNSYPRFHIEITLMKLVNMDKTVTIKSLIDSFGSSGNSAENVDSELPSYMDSKKKNSIEVTPEIPKEDIVENEKEELASSNHPDHQVAAFEPKPIKITGNIKDEWEDFLTFIAEERSSISTFISFVTIKNITESEIELAFPQGFDFQFQEISKPSNLEFISKKILEFTGKTFSLKISIKEKIVQESEESETKVKVSNTPSAILNSSTIDEDMEKEPIIKEIITLFKGTVI